MRHLLSSFKSALRRRSPAAWFATLALPVIGAASFLAIGTVSAPNIPAINLSADPLYAVPISDKPVLALALSVEFPTVGAQYVDVPASTTDASYSNSNEYLGYYDAESCYRYLDAPTETPRTGETTSDYKRFELTGKAIALTAPDATNPYKTSRTCADAFSGNFLNWASNSAIDMLRLSLTGGDRYIDIPSVTNSSGVITTPSLTILQRAVIPNGDPTCMWNSPNFPSKRLSASGGSSGAAYFGAIPTVMRTAAGAGTVYVANTLNRIYFGTSEGGGCGNTSSYTLGGAPAAVQKGPSVTSTGSLLPSDAVLISGEGTTTTFNGTREIWFGSNDSNKNWTVLPAYGGIDCFWQGGGGPYGGINDPQGGVAKQCYSRPYSGSWAATTTTSSSANSNGFFYSRVRVCNTDSSNVLQDTRDYGLCTKYPNGDFRPTGAVQKYSTNLRLAAFGYLMDQTRSDQSGRYGGVLRAPVKYVGAKTYDKDGVENTPTGGNPGKEWNENTGAFIDNPDGNSAVASASGAYLSGVINYVNRFGRTGPVAGRYKIYDPVGELHYEALRYLQGLQPSSAAVSSITSDMYDGYPASTSWTDPYAGRSASSNYSCLKSNIVVIGDINTWDGNRLPAADSSKNIPDIGYWRGVVQSFEKKTTATYVDGQGGTRSITNPNSANSSVPSSYDRSQIMGSAYWARTHDIRGTNWTTANWPSSTVNPQMPGLRVKTFTFDVNEYAAQNNAATRRTANQFFMASKYGGFETDPSNLSKNPYNTSGNPFYEDGGAANSYVWADTDPRTSRQGEANTYFLQSDARGVLSAFDDIFARASTAARSIAGGAIQSKNLTQAGDVIYQGTFDTSDWSGDLLAIPVSLSSSNVANIGTTPLWKAGDLLTALPTPATTRNIVIGRSGAASTPNATNFIWSAIDSSLQTALNKPTPSSVSDGLGQDRLNYIRGDRSKESSPFRKRNKLMGDVVNSGVVYSGAPATSISTSDYAAFYTANKNRTPAVFVGANDGMLHAFNGTTGDELFAYIPSWIAPNLPALTQPTYATAHQSYVDGTATIGDAQLGSNATDWKTVLVSGTGGGGQGVFALDVTTPTSFTTNNVLWEFTHTDDVDLGNVVGRPQILKLRTSASSATTPTYKWFAVFGSGVNSYVADSTGSFGSGAPSIFLLDLSKPIGTAWSLGTNYYKISFPFDATRATTMPTGITNFRATLGLKREVTAMFVGDLHGNLWKLDFSTRSASDWNVNKLSAFNKGTSASPDPYPLFVARSGAETTDGTSTETRRPIVVAPTIAFGPKPGTYYVLFGTGKFMEVSDKTNTNTQSFYMVYDDGTSTGDTLTSGVTRASAVSGRQRLKAGSASATAVTVPAYSLGRAVNNTDSANPRSGWVFDFPGSGERQSNFATIFGTNVIFGSLIPGATTGTIGCQQANGGGTQYTVNIASGNGTATSSTVGIMGEPLVVNVPPATTYSPFDSTGKRTKMLTSQVVQQGSLGVALGGTQSQPVIVGRLSWRQLNNYQDLKNAP